MADIYLDVNVALAEVPVNKLPLVDDTDFKTKEESVAYNAAGMDLVWNFVTHAGAFTQTAVTPTTGGDYDWTNQGNGMYTIEIPASGGASINNATEGCGWFTGVATGVLPWTSPVYEFRPANINDNHGVDLYQDRIWVDTVNGSAGTTDDVNGTITDKVSSFPNALTIGASKNITNYEVANDSSITLAAAFQSKTITGEGYSVALGSQNIDKSFFVGATISGIGTNATSTDRPTFIGGTINTATLDPCTIFNAKIGGNITVGTAGDFELINCEAYASRTIDMGAVGATNLSLTSWFGDVSVTNIATGDVVNIESRGGTVTVNGTGGTANIFGAPTSVTDSSGGSVTVNDNSLSSGGAPSAAAIRTEIDNNSTQLAAIVADTNELQGDWADGGRLDLILDARASQTSVDAKATSTALSTLQTTANAIETDTQDIQSRIPAALVTGRMDVSVSAIDDDTTALANQKAGLLAMESGTASGTPTTTVMASDVTGFGDDTFIGREIHFTSGACEGEKTDISDYVSSSGTFTFTAVTTAPSSSDTFIII